MAHFWPFHKQSRSIIGLEIQDTSLKVVQLALSDRVPLIEQYATQSLPEGLVEHGEIKEPDELAESLRQLLEQTSRHAKYVHVALPSSQVMIRFLKMPDVPERQLRKVMDHEVKHHVYLPFEDPIYDFVKQNKTNHGEACEVMLVAASRNTRDAYMDVIHRAGRVPVSMEVRALSILRAITASGIVDVNGTFLQVDLQEQAAELSIFHQRKLQITRTIPLQFSPRDVLAAACRELVIELERLMDFYRYTLNHRDHTFHQLVLTGDIAAFDEVYAELRGLLAVEVKRFEAPWLGNEDAASLAVPIGLALRGHRRESRH